MSRERRSMDRIVVGVDGSEGSAEALRWAARLASACGAEVVAVHVIDPSTYDLRSLHGAHCPVVVVPRRGRRRAGSGS